MKNFFWNDRLKVLALWVVASVVCFSTGSVYAALILQEEIVTEAPSDGAFALVTSETTSPIVYDERDWAGVIRAIGDLQLDIERVSGKKPVVSTSRVGSKHVVIVGTRGKSKLIDNLVASQKMTVNDLEGQWESFLITTVENPVAGVDQALVIAGSDKRGTIYGIYELSEQLGVSPWYWWADVPPKKRTEAYVLPGRYASGEPKVKYRGIFINDEEPAFGPWAREKFGGVNSKMYTHMFELILRLRGNYLWPAMWGKAFNEDDPMNPVLANEYGIVMGTSHHEPMIRAQQEWTKRKRTIGNGEWNYATNEEGLRNFWTEGIKRNKDFESIVTIGMRGDGDEEMVRGGNMDDNVALLEKIVADQREILKEYMNPDVTQIPQLWALYKEVMDYYEHGMRVPDDVTLLWCDDNWGNIRRLPTPEERKRSGGAGIYYHFDYVGGPRSYRWINTNPLPKIWEQMNLAYEYDANEIWIVNVGDLKPMELPIEFFLRMAWDPEALPKEKIGAFTEKWAARDFGAEHAEEIADIVSKYLKYAGWRKPELIDPNTFSVVDYREAERVSEQWNDLVKRAEKVNAALPEEHRDAFYQLGLYPAKAFATVVDMYIAAAYNRLFVEQGRASANLEAEKTRELFAQDQALSDYFHTEISDGKWNHMMSQNRIGYTSWAEPRRQVMPSVKELEVPDTNAFGVAIDGSRSAWPGANGDPVLPPFDSINNQRSFIDVFQRGSKAINYAVKASQPWVVVRKGKAFNGVDDRLWVEIDWDKTPVGKAEGEIVIGNAEQKVAVKVSAHKATVAQEKAAKGAFGGLVGPIAIDAGDYSKKQSVNGVCWEAIPDYLRAESAMTIFPTTAESILPPNEAPYIEYPVYIAEPGKVDVDLIFGPVLAFVPGRGIRVAVSFDDQAPQVLNVVTTNDRAWNSAVQDNSRRLTSSHEVKIAGKHTIRITMVDPAVVLQRLIVHKEPLPRTYFGPETVKTEASSAPKSFVSKGKPVFTGDFAADPVTVSSPNGIIKIEVQADASGALIWSVDREGKEILTAAPLGLTVEDKNLGEGVTLGKPQSRTIKETYSTFGNHSEALNYCTETAIPIERADGLNYVLDVRAYDDGVAVRYRVKLDDAEHQISGESTGFALPVDARAWWEHYDQSYENPCESSLLSGIPENAPLSPPITFGLGDDLYVSLTEANNDCFPDMGLVRRGNMLQPVYPASSQGWTHEGAITTPWRAAIIADGLTALVNSDLITNLCPPPSEELANADWIKPGRSLWQWWAIGAPKYEDQKDWVDAAKTLGFEYYLIDDGWRYWNAPGKDQWQCLKEVIDYAKSQDVGALVWVNSAEMRDATSRRAYLEKVAALGAVGIKIDFIPPCTAEITRWYEGALKDTAELKLLCNFHGSVKLTGRQRTWPHELTREAVRGHEYHMTRYGRVQAADHDTIVPFTRYLCGPADYTPTAFDPKEMVGYTGSHLLAQAVVMTSPLLHFAGKYQDFIGNPAEDLIRHLPATWDETIVLPGSEIGKVVGFARRCGQEWYIGVLNGGEETTLPIDLSFLGDGPWKAKVFADDFNNPATFKKDAKTVTARDRIEMPMSPRGGLVVWITQ